MAWMFPLLQSHLPLPSDPYGVLDIYLLSKKQMVYYVTTKKSRSFIVTNRDANEPALVNCCKFAVGIGGLEPTRLMA